MDDEFSQPFNSQVASQPKGDRVVAAQPCWKWLQHLAIGETAGENHQTFSRLASFSPGCHQGKFGDVGIFPEILSKFTGLGFLFDWFSGCHVCNRKQMQFGTKSDGTSGCYGIATYADPGPCCWDWSMQDRSRNDQNRLVIGVSSPIALKVLQGCDVWFMNVHL